MKKKTFILRIYDGKEKFTPFYDPKLYKIV